MSPSRHKVSHILLISYTRQRDFVMILNKTSQILFSKPLITFFNYSISCEVSHSLYHPLQREKHAALNHLCYSEPNLFAPFKRLGRDAYFCSFLLREGIQYPQFAGQRGTDLYSVSLLDCWTRKKKPRPSQSSCSASCWLHYFPRNCTGETQCLSSVGSSPMSGWGIITTCCYFFEIVVLAASPTII